MENVIALITAGRGEFGALTTTRPAHMLPFGCRYRLVDFALSACTNNCIENVALYGGSMLRSTIDHIGNGKPWDLNRRFGGLSIFPTFFNKRYNRDDELMNIFDSLEFYEEKKEEHIFFIDPMTVTKIDIEEVYRTHLEKDSDITVIYKTVHDPVGKYLNYNKITVNVDGAMKNIGINLGTEEHVNISLGMGFMKKSVFVDVVKKAMEQGDAYTLKAAILSEKEKYQVDTYAYFNEVFIIKDVNTYMEANMELLHREKFEEIFYKNGIILTKNKDEPSTLYHDYARVENSILANGCEIDGTVQNSVLFRDVIVGKNAIIKNSVVMEGAVVEEDAVVINCIIDKYAIIKAGVSLVGSTVSPYIISKKKVIKK